MSIEAVSWAFKLKLKSSAKFVLVCMCDFANEDGIFWPSLASLQEKTCLDRKTIISAIDSLEKEGYIIDTGGRRGETGQIKIYSLSGDLSNQTHYVYKLTAENGQYYIGVRSCYGTPKEDEYMGSGAWPKYCQAEKIALKKEILSVHQTRKLAEEDERNRIEEHISEPLCQNRKISNNTKNGTVKRKNETVPNFPSKSTVFPGKESQISAERVPNLGHGTVMEPSIEPSWNRQVECARDALPATVATEPEKIEPKKPERAKRKTRLPDDWFLPKEWGEWALAQGMLESEIREEADRFADHWRSNGEGKVDWLATWRNWVRRRRQFTRIPARVKRNEPESMESLLARSARDAEKLKHLFEKRK